MVRKLDYNLVKNAIELAIQLDNFHGLGNLESQLLEIIIRVKLIIDSCAVPSLFDLELLKQLRTLHVLIISVKD